MRKIIASSFLTLDGVMEAPGSGDTTLPGKRGWSEPFMTPELGMLIMSQMDNNDALLLGRVTYEAFAAFWPSVPDEDPFGKRMNGMTKYVVTTTLNKADWKNSKLVKGNIPEEIRKLKEQPGKNLSITGSGTLIRSLLQHDLLDELQLLICPVVLGVGKHLFGAADESKTLKLADSKTYPTGMVLLTYHKA
jgi:dihydrofolate reductase